MPENVVRELVRERPDLGFVESIPVRLVPNGIMKPYMGWHHWERVDGKPVTVEIFVEDGHSGELTKEILRHEACHHKDMSKFPEIYVRLSEQSKEKLVVRCEVAIDE